MYRWMGRARLFLVPLIVVVFFGSAAGPPGANAAPISPNGAKLSAVPGTIAYTRNFRELHLVQPNGSTDKTVWTEPASSNTLYSAMWRPDAQEIGFASSHEQLTSLFTSDIYGIQTDGTGLRRITNPPDPSQYGSFATGTVVVTVTDFDVAGPFVIWMEGAPAPQSVTSGGGTLTFNNVAVFPGQVQFPVAMNGSNRWIPPGAGVTVQPGGTVSTSIDISSASQLDNWGAFSGVWRSDGAQIDYALGSAQIGNDLPTYPAAGAIGQVLMQFAVPLGTFDRGPTPALANQILYWTMLGPDGNQGFYKAAEGSATGGTLVHATGFGEGAYGVKWLPDGSGFLFSKSDESLSYAASNIYEYDFGTQATTQLTHFTTEFAANLSVSPDGTTIVFEHSTQDPAITIVPQDLWIMSRSGSAAPGLFIANGRSPSWSRTNPGPPSTPTSVPSKTPTTVPTNTPIPLPTHTPAPTATPPSIGGPPSGGPVTTLASPARLVDTRSSGGAITNGSSRCFGVAGLGGIPGDASAVVLNVTSVGQTTSGWLTVYPSGQAVPATSTLNFGTSEYAMANGTIMRLGTGGQVCVHVGTINSAPGSSNVILDATGYRSSAALTQLAMLASPVRLADTRSAGGPISTGTSRCFQAAGLSGIPADAAAVVLNVTAVGYPTNGWLTAYPSGQAVPATSTLNFDQSEYAMANNTIMRIGTSGQVCVNVGTINSAPGSSNVILDATGYLSAAAVAQLPMLASPQRVVDTRTSGGPIATGTSRCFAIAGLDGIPANAIGLIANVTAVGYGTNGWLSAYPNGQAVPATSTLNFDTSEYAMANGAIIALGSGGQVCVNVGTLNAAPGTAQVILDVVGYLKP